MRSTARAVRMRAQVLCLGAGLLGPLAACGSPPPDPGPLLAKTSQHMVLLKGFHFQMQIQGFTGSTVPVESANGDAHPPDLHSSVQLRQGGVLVQLEIIFSADQVYLKSFTGGWQRLTAAEVVQFFDPHSLFDQQDGLFAALKDTQSPKRGKQENVGSQSTWVISGTLPADRVHRLLTLISDQGSYTATYWIDSASDNLWRARLQGHLFDPTKESTVTFEFSNHDQPVTVTPPPVS